MTMKAPDKSDRQIAIRHQKKKTEPHGRRFAFLFQTKKKMLAKHLEIDC